MEYTVKQLANLSGVSARTLRFYDEINLLKPARSKTNNYRYYDQEKLMLLQQILFFRELEFSLSDIKRFLCDPKFDKAQTLAQHKILLERGLKKTNTLIKTIDKTLSYLKGENQMNNSNLYDGFHKKIESALNELSLDVQQVWHDAGISNTDIEKMMQHSEVMKSWTMDEWNQFNSKIKELLKQFAEAINNGYLSSSPETQLLVDKYYNLLGYSNGNVSRETFYLLSIQGLETSLTVDFYKSFHPDLPVYILEALKIFSQR